MTDETVDEEFLQITFKHCRFHAHMGLELEVVSKGEVRVRAPYKRELDQGMGYLHGGVFSVLLDTATYYAALSHYGRSGQLPLTQELKINLIATAKEEDVTATAKLLHAGRSVAVAEAKLHTAAGKLVAAGLASMLVRG
jgi:1,4-dihydroxy-2-naphthoyl-CoA hydrolase